MANRDDDLIKRGTENQAEGKLDHAKGHLKDAWGGATGDTSTQLEGKVDQAKGKVKDAFGKAQREAGEEK